MPRLRITPEALAACRALEVAGWTQGEMSKVFSVDVSTISHALRKRKIWLPNAIEVKSGEMLAGIMDRVHRRVIGATRRELEVIVRELKKRERIRP